MSEGKQGTGESFLRAYRCDTGASTEIYIKTIVYKITQILRSDSSG